MKPLLFCACLLLAACGKESRVEVDRQYKMDGGWQVPKEDGPSLDATGKVATLRFQNRVFVFEMEKFRGHIDMKEVVLYGDGGIRIHITPESIRVEQAGGHVELPLEKIPPNSRVTYKDRKLIVK